MAAKPNRSEHGSAKVGRRDFDEMKLTYSLPEVMNRMNYPVRLNGRQGVRHCPFHGSRDTPSLSVFPRGSIYLFKCQNEGECGKTGSVLDFVWHFHPELARKPTETLAFLESLTGQSLSGFSPERRSSISYASPLATEGYEAGGSVIDPSAIPNVPQARVLGAYKHILAGGVHQVTQSYALSRNWLKRPGELFGVEPYPLGAERYCDPNHLKSTLRHHSFVAFRKLIRLRTTAELFGLEELFDRQRGFYCAGTKWRFTPEVFEEVWRRSIPWKRKLWEAEIQERLARKEEVEEKVWRDEMAQPPKFLCESGFSNYLPHEFDANRPIDDADFPGTAKILAIAEGPGDGLCLFNKAHETKEAHERFGVQMHIVAAENACAWNEGSLERRIGEGGRVVSFFKGYHGVVLFLDPDAAGLKSADKAVRLALTQAPNTPVKKVVLPDGGDVCEFFKSERGNTIFDLFEIVRATKAITSISDLA